MNGRDGSCTFLLWFLAIFCFDGQNIFVKNIFYAYLYVVYVFDFFLCLTIKTWIILHAFVLFDFFFRGQNYFL